MASESNHYGSRGRRAQHRDDLSIAHTRILGVLSFGGMLTSQQIARVAGLTRWKTRQAVSELTRRDLLFSSTRTGRYEITQLGREALLAKAFHFWHLDR